MNSPEILRLGLVQQAASADVATNTDAAAQAVADLAAQGAHIICLQELFRSPYFCQTLDAGHFALAEPAQGPSFARFSELARAHKVVILLPLYEQAAPGLYYNSLVVIDADGSYLGTYRKQHIPHDPGFEEKYYFAPGDGGYRVWDTQYGRIGALICWDQWYPEAARLTALQGAQVLFYPTAIGYSAGEPAEEGAAQLSAWQTMQRSHAIANGVYVAAVNRVGTEGDIRFWGNSFVADPFGRVLAAAGENPANLLVEIDTRKIAHYRQQWPFLRDRRVDTYAPLSRRWLGDDPTTS